MLNKLYRLFALVCSLYASFVTAGPLEDGHTAFDNKQYKKAYDIWIKPAQQGDPEAQYNIGLLYMKGLGVEHNDREALKWFTYAGEQGLADAQYNAGVMFYTGKGVYPDYKSAIDWWTLAVAQGHANAENNLAIMYAFAYGTKLDTEKAIQLWTAAAQQGHPDAIDSLINAYSGKIAGFKPDQAKASYWQAKKTQP